MSDILNNFFENDKKKIKNKIVNFKGFLSCRFISPSFNIFKLSPITIKNLNDKNFLINSYKGMKSLNSERQNINSLSKKSYYINDSNRNISLSGSNKNYLNTEDTSANIYNSKKDISLRKKFLNKSKISHSVSHLNKFTKKSNSVNKKFELPKSINLSHYQKENNAHLNNKKENMIQNKVDNIMNDLFSNKMKNFKLNYTSFKNYPLNLSINPKKYIDANLKNEPYNKKLFLSLNEQIKCLGSKKLRAHLMEGVNDYTQNVKRYNNIDFDYFNYNNNKDLRRSEKKIRNIFNINKTKNNFYFGNTKYNDLTKMRQYNNPYELGLKKFRKEYITSYKEKRYNFPTNQSYLHKNEYLQLVDDKTFNKMIPIEERLKIVYQSIQKTTNNIGKNTSNLLLD